MPALPLDEAGKYVAAAYLVFLTLLIVYVAIMGMKIARIEREIGELLELEEAKDEPLRSPRRPRPRRERAPPRPRHLAPHRAAGAARAAGDARGPRHLACWPSCAPTTRCTRPWWSPPATAPSSTWSAGDPVEAETAALAVLARQAGIRPTELTDSLYAMRDRDAVRHLFSVAAGLDSMIIGEAEIQGQIKRAYELALVEGATGPISNRLFREALGRRQARAHRDRRRARPRVGVRRSRCRWPRASSAT